MTTTTTPTAPVTVTRGRGVKVHAATQLTVRGTLRIVGTRCATDVLAGSTADVTLRPVSGPVTCTRCLQLAGEVAVTLAATPAAPADLTHCATHVGGGVHATKTIKRGTYTMFTCGCRVWH